MMTWLIHLLVNAIVIKIAGKLFSGFDVRSFTTAIWLAIALALAAAVVDNLFLY